MFLFKKKTKPKKETIPVDFVKSLSSKGLSEQEIVAVLRKYGYSPYQIERALSLALKETVSGFNPPEKVVPGEMIKERVEPKKLPAPPEPLQPLNEKTPVKEEFYTMEPKKEEHVERSNLPAPPTPSPVPSQPTQPAPSPQPPMLPSSQGESLSPSEPSEPEFTFEESPEEVFEKPEEPGPREEMPEITLEEIIEGIVEEKWAGFEETVSELRKTDEELRREIEKLKDEIEKIKESMKKSEESLIEKLEEHGEHVETIEARIGSIEKVFKEFIPELTENIKLLKEAIEKK